MKKYSKVGNRTGKPAYRTPSWHKGRPARLEGKAQKAGLRPVRKPKKS